MKSFTDYGNVSGGFTSITNNQFSPNLYSYQQHILDQNQQLHYHLQHQQQLQQLQMQRAIQQQQQQQVAQQQQQHQYYDEPELPLLMAVRVMDGLFVGNAMAAQDEEFLFSNKVTHIVNCAGLDAANTFNDNGIEYLTFPWRDVSTTQILDAQDRNICRITKFIEKAFDKGECVLVHSLHGISRSCVVLAAYLVYKYGWSLELSLSFMHLAHPDMRIQTYFIRQLKLLSKRKSRPSEPTDPVLREQHMLLKHTYLNSMPLSETEYTNMSQMAVHHRRTVNFETKEYVLGPRASIPDPKTIKTNGILKVPDNFVPPNTDVPTSFLDRPRSRTTSSQDSTVIDQEVKIASTQQKITNSSADQRLKQTDLKSSTDSQEGSSQLQIITGADANKTDRPYIANVTSSDDSSSSVGRSGTSGTLSYEYSKLLNRGESSLTSSSPNYVTPIMGDTPSGAPSSIYQGGKEGESEQQQQALDSTKHSYNLRRRPTSFSTTAPPVSLTNKSDTKHETSTTVPIPHKVPTQPKKFRGPTPPKRPQSTSTTKKDSHQPKSSSSNFNPAQYNYMPQPQEQEPLFLRVNRKPLSPTNSQGMEERRSMFRTSSSGGSSLLQGTVSSNLKRGSGSGLENVQVRRRPSSAPKTRPLLTSTTTTTDSQSGSSVKQTVSVPSLQAIYGSGSNGRPMSAPTANSLASPKRKKKKKKVQPKKEVENRLMRPTLSFLRKTVIKSK